MHVVYIICYKNVVYFSFLRRVKNIKKSILLLSLKTNKYTSNIPIIKYGSQTTKKVFKRHIFQQN